MENKPSYSTVAAFLLLASALAFSQTLSPSSPGELPAPQEVLAAADRVRIPDQPFRVTLALVEYINGKPRDRTGLVVYVRQDKQTRQYNNLVRYSEPPRDAGKMVLFKVNNLWFYDPASQASIRISAQQRLTGQASQGDVLTVNLSKDYTPNIVGEETLQDADRTNRDCWHLDMPAATPDAVYHRIEYWVERGTFRPIKGKFYADSGRLLKIAYYHKYQEQLGAARPTEIILIDSVNANLATTINYSGYRFQDIPEGWFQRDYLPRLRPE